jgi:hypothetical protein
MRSGYNRLHASSGEGTEPLSYVQWLLRAPVMVRRTALIVLCAGIQTTWVGWADLKRLD